MDFDFYEQYKGYSNTDLLIIVQRPEEYQPAAVTAVQQLLNERVVSPEDIQAAKEHYEQVEKGIAAKKEKVDKVKARVTDLLEPVLNPTEKTETGKWVRILLLIIAIQYAWQLFETLKLWIDYMGCKFCRLDMVTKLGFLSLLYVPVVFYLLWKRKRWGWILLFADNLFVLILSLFQSLLFFKYLSIHQGDMLSYLFSIVIKILIVVFLWREPVSAYFGVNIDTKKKTAGIVSAISILFILMLVMMV